jgi:hypothetical protein
MFRHRGGGGDGPASCQQHDTDLDAMNVPARFTARSKACFAEFHQQRGGTWAFRFLHRTRLVGAALKEGDIVVSNQTVYPRGRRGGMRVRPGAVLEQASGLKAGSGFDVGYSPERINPGDKGHHFESMTKVVSARNAKTLDIVAKGLRIARHRRHSPDAFDPGCGSRKGDREHPARPQHRVHERAVAELQALDIDTRRRCRDALAAARTEWNFLPFQPGVVGGHCIGVDPYYLAYRAEKAATIPRLFWQAAAPTTKWGIGLRANASAAVAPEGQGRDRNDPWCPL